MSYFTADLDNNQRESEKTPMSEEKKIINPRFSGKTHSSEAKERIREKQLARYEAMRKLIRKGMQKPMTEERVKEICNEVIDDFCKKNLIEVRENKRPMNINL
jgi:hypothetical protein